MRYETYPLTEAEMKMMEPSYETPQCKKGEEQTGWKLNSAGMKVPVCVKKMKMNKKIENSGMDRFTNIGKNKGNSRVLRK